MQDPDADLVRRIARGDRRAAEALARRRLPALLAVARRFLGDPTEAEDVAQETFIRAWRAAPNWREGEAKFETWMRRVAVNLCLDRLRRRRPASADALELLADPAPGAAAGVLADQRAARVQAALVALPERQRTALNLCYFEEMSNIEAAAAMEVSVEALESLLARGRRALKAALAMDARDLLGAADE